MQIIAKPLAASSELVKGLYYFVMKTLLKSFSIKVNFPGMTEVRTLSLSADKLDFYPLDCGEHFLPLSVTILYTENISTIWYRIKLVIIVSENISESAAFLTSYLHGLSVNWN